MPARDPEVPISEELRTFTSADTVHRGDTLAGLLLRNRMGLQEIEKVLREIRTRDYFSPRSLLPGQVLEFTRDDADRLVRLAVRCSPEEIYVFELQPRLAALLRAGGRCGDRVRKLSGTVQSDIRDGRSLCGGKRAARNQAGRDLLLRSRLLHGSPTGRQVQPARRGALRGGLVRRVRPDPLRLLPGRRGQGQRGLVPRGRTAGRILRPRPATISAGPS